MKNITIGSDPEVFLEDAVGNFVNAFDGYVDGVVKGNKRHPELTKYGALQVDGMAMEINTTPTASAGQFYNSITEGLTDIRTRFKQEISKKSCWKFNEDYLQQQPPMATELGCSPDNNAWKKGDYNNPPSPYSLIRTAGGHIHIGWDMECKPYTDKHIDMCCDIVQQLDYVVGLWSLRTDVMGSDRRELYGNAGAFRPKPYGLEYRVLSNFWVFDEDLCKTVFNRTLKAIDLYNKEQLLSSWYGDKAKVVINTGDLTNPLIDEVEDKVIGASTNAVAC